MDTGVSGASGAREPDYLLIYLRYAMVCEAIDIAIAYFQTDLVILSMYV